MRVSIVLSPDERRIVRQLAQKSRRTVSGEVSWAVLQHIKAHGYVEPKDPGPPEVDPEDDEVPLLPLDPVAEGDERPF